MSFRALSASVLVCPLALIGLDAALRNLLPDPARLPGRSGLRLLWVLRAAGPGRRFL